MIEFPHFYGWIIFLCVCITTSLSVHPLMNSGGFHILAAINNAVRNMGVHISFWVSVFISLGYTPRSEITGSYHFLMFKLVLEKTEEPEIKLPTSTGSWKKQESSRKTSISYLLTMPKPLTVWITINCGKFFKRWEYQTTWPASWEICMQVRKQLLALDMEHWTGSK